MYYILKYHNFFRKSSKIFSFNEMISYNYSQPNSQGEGIALGFIGLLSTDSAQMAIPINLVPLALLVEREKE